MKTVQKIIDSFGGLDWLRQEENYIKIKLASRAMMPLVIEYIGDWQGKPHFPMISVAHYYTQNGDQMRDPEMVFFLDMSAPVPGIPPAWTPISYQQDNMGIYNQVYDLGENGDIKRIRVKLISELTSFSKSWDMQIKAHGYGELTVNLAA